MRKIQVFFSETGDHYQLEDEINEWVDNTQCNIVGISQSEAVLTDAEGNEVSTLTITVLYDEPA